MKSKPTKQKPAPTSAAQLISSKARAHNAQVLDTLRSAFCAISGSTAGILGLLGLSGFAFYLLSALTFAALVSVFKCHRRPTVFFGDPVWDLGVSSVSASGLFSYVLFWTMVSGVIRIYG